MFLPTPGCPQSVCNMFSVVPAVGVVGPNDKPISFQVCVMPTRELSVKDEPILHCQVIEPRKNSIVAGNSSARLPSVASIGDAIANIPIRVSCHSSYSKYVMLFFYHLLFSFCADKARFHKTIFPLVMSVCLFVVSFAKFHMSNTTIC